MAKRAAFSVDFGKQIKSAVDQVRGESPSGRSETRQFSGSSGQFRLAQVLQVSTVTLPDNCRVEVYKVRLVVADFPEVLGDQLLVIESLADADYFAAAPADDSYVVGDVVSVQSWNNRYWIQQLYAPCGTVVECCACSAEVTLGSLGGTGLPIEWIDILSNGPHVLTGGTSSGSICRYALSLDHPNGAIPSGDCTLYPYRAPLQLLLRHNTSTGTTEFEISTFRRYNSGVYVGGVEQIGYAEFSAIWTGTAPTCGVSSESGDLATAFVSQTAEPTCSGDQTFRQGVDIITGLGTGCWDYISWGTPNNSPCIGIPPDFTPSGNDFADYDRPAEWLFRELIGVDFSSMTATMGWIDCVE